MGRRHEFGTTNGRSVLWFFGRGETLGELGSLGVMDVFENGGHFDRIELVMANKEWVDSLGRRHEFGTTNGR